MIVETIRILSKYGDSVVDQIRENLSSSRTNATGQTSKSLQYTVKRDGSKIILQVTGRPFFFAVETGRGPRKSNKSSGLVMNILEWMEARGIGNDLDQKKRLGLAKFITLKINREGTKLYQKGGRKDIVSNVVNDTLINKISEELLEEFGKYYLQQAVKISSK